MYPWPNINPGPGMLIMPNPLNVDRIQVDHLSVEEVRDLILTTLRIDPGIGICYRSNDRWMQHRWWKTVRKHRSDAEAARLLAMGLLSGEDFSTWSMIACKHAEIIEAWERAGARIHYSTPDDDTESKSGATGYTAPKQASPLQDRATGIVGGRVASLWMNTYSPQLGSTPAEAERMGNLRVR